MDIARILSIVHTRGSSTKLQPCISQMRAALPHTALFRIFGPLSSMYAVYALFLELYLGVFWMYGSCLLYVSSYECSVINDIFLKIVSIHIMRDRC